MKRSINFVILIGNCGKDPILGDANGTPVASFNLATNEGYKDKNGEWQDRTTWHRIQTFGKDAQLMVDQIRKGDTVTVVGSIENRTKGEGENRRTYSSVICKQFTVQPKYGQPEQQPSPEYNGGNSDYNQDNLPF